MSDPTDLDAEDTPVQAPDHRRDPKHRDAIQAIIDERKYQKERWGEDHHTLMDWASLMSVYSGKVVQTVPPFGLKEDLRAFRKRVTQLAAICAAALEQTEVPDEDG